VGSRPTGLSTDGSSALRPAAAPLATIATRIGRASGCPRLAAHPHRASTLAIVTPSQAMIVAIPACPVTAIAR